MDQSIPLIQRTISCACDGGCPRCASQSSQDVKVGSPNDAYEQEADSMAERVMRMPESMIQRQPIEEEEEMLQPKPLDGQFQSIIQKQCCEEEEESVQTKATGGRQPNQSHQSIGSKVRYHAVNCPGKPLHGSTRNFFEPRFGQDFSGVRVHTCDSSVQMSDELRAQAFTYGNSIFFNSGKYNPESFQGKQLLGHELTHVVQQNEGVIRRQSATIVCDGEGGYEPDLRGHSKATCRMDECVFYHEGIHSSDWLERWPNGCKTKKGNPRPKGAKIPLGEKEGEIPYADFLNASECSAWDVTRRCVEHHLPHAEGDCVKKLEAELKGAKAQIEHYC